MSLEDLTDEPEGSLADIINTQLEAGAAVIYLGELGRKIGITEIEVLGRLDKTLASAIERGRIVTQRQLRGRSVANDKPSKLLN